MDFGAAEPVAPEDVASWIPVVERAGSKLLREIVSRTSDRSGCRWSKVKGMRRLLHIRSLTSLVSSELSRRHVILERGVIHEQGWLYPIAKRREGQFQRRPKSISAGHLDQGTRFGFHTAVLRFHRSSGEHTRPSASDWNVVRSRTLTEQDEMMLEEAEKQDSVNLNAEFDDTGCEQKDAGAAAAGQTACDDVGRTCSRRSVRKMTRGLWVQKMRKSLIIRGGVAAERPGGDPEVLGGEEEARDPLRQLVPSLPSPEEVRRHRVSRGVRSAWQDRLMIGLTSLLIELESCWQCQKYMPATVSHVTTQEESTRPMTGRRRRRWHTSSRSRVPIKNGLPNR